MEIKELRGKTGLSQRKFSDLTGIPLGTLQRWERGQNEPPTYLLTLLEKVLRYENLI